MNTVLQTEHAQRAVRSRPNLTGIPAQMKLDFETRSGLSFDDVRVQYNSPKPAQLRALAYTQGNRVYLGPGQARHLGHELGHVIQQKRGMVRPSGYRNGIPVNEGPALERQADQAAWAAPQPTSREASCAIQFEKGNIIARIAALLNINGLNHDRNNMLYKALKCVEAEAAGGTGSKKSGKKGKGKPAAGQLTSGLDPYEYLQRDELSEEQLAQVEALLLDNISESPTAAEADTIYGKVEESKAQSYFSDDFIARHFAQDYNAAWRISIDRFASGETTINTVMPDFQKDIFFSQECVGLYKADQNLPYTTSRAYLAWHFVKRNTPPDQPGPETLQRGNMVLDRNSDKKICHLSTIANPTNVTLQNSTSPRYRDVAYDELCEICRVLEDELLQGLGDCAAAGTVMRLMNFFHIATDRFFDSNRREDQAMLMTAQTFTNLFNALSNAYMDIEAWNESATDGEGEGPRYAWDYNFANQLQTIKERLDSLNEFYELRAYPGAYRMMQDALNGFITICRTKHGDSEFNFWEDLFPGQ